jgi:hypothetical protein
MFHGMYLGNLEEGEIILNEEDLKVAELIARRRRQILVHSYIYYEMNSNVISDSTWSKWAMELVELQNKYPEIAKKTVFSKTFENFDGSSGYDLDYTCDYAVRHGNDLLKYHAEHPDED